MSKALDTLLQTVVSAELAAQHGGFERYRYECIFCGEEVFVAAPFSTKVVPHFRHRSGNNNVECEKYLGKYGAFGSDIRLRTDSRGRVEFYYENSRKTFSLSLWLSESDIREYEQKNTDLELRINDSEPPFYTLKINGTNFTPNVPTQIYLNRFSPSYYLSISKNVKKRKHDLFNRKFPTFFKIQGVDEDFKAKLVRNKVLYTNTQYFIVLQDNCSEILPKEFPSEVDVKERFQFEAMNRVFVGMVLLINRKTPTIEKMLLSWDYKLDSSESLTLLWPPSNKKDELYIIESEYAYIYSSFELTTFKNINVNPENILKLSKDISRIFIKQNIRIFERNAEIIISKGEVSDDVLSNISPSKEEEERFKVPDNNSYFLFNKSGVSPLMKGQVVYLTPESLIARYEHTYPTNFIYPYNQKDFSGEELLEDILAHYKLLESLNLNEFSSVRLSKTASQYIDSCMKEGLINVKAKQFILEGKI